jgi:hypothetical protein
VSVTFSARAKRNQKEWGAVEVKRRKRGHKTTPGAHMSGCEPPHHSTGLRQVTHLPWAQFPHPKVLSDGNKVPLSSAEEPESGAHAESSQERGNEGRSGQAK